MKVTAVDAFRVAPKFLFVRVRTDEGVTGWGEAGAQFRSRSVAAAVAELGEYLIGKDPLAIEAHWQIMRKSGFYRDGTVLMSALAALDEALWDIAGKVRGAPVHELLGGPVRDEIALYTHPDQRKFTTREGVVAEIRDIVASGHTALKFDPFPFQRGGREQDDGYLDGSMTRKDEREAAELTALIRETTGPDIEILIDAHGRFDVPTAIRLCRTLEDAGQIDWFEEPVPPESYGALQQVRERVNCAITVGERLHTRWEFVPILENKLADYLMPDVTWAGGITELKKISTLAEAYYVPISPHDASGPINVVAGAHVMMTVPNFYRLETSRYDLGKYDAFIETPLDNRGGSLRLPALPGLGLTMNMDYLKAHAVDGFGG
jgi:galactonate dehydratase